MKKLLVLALLVFAIWKGYEHLKPELPVEAPAVTLHDDRQSYTAPAVAQAAVFKCDGRQHCSQMTSRAEAEFFVRNCPDTKMDGDGDGEPCENDSRF